ncbi:PaaI family thioesterase [uncultured Clostridium sp.]|uniref:PaaI family thioesterase n=1 Tax=uncultured Clostridium sp. TaxID=59620 RepID=UPI0025E1DECF|nr:PaaI family thioesterase [uncultured Clostridium sp.]
MEENKTENRMEEKQNGEKKNEEKQGGTYSDIYAEGGALGPDAVDFRDKIGMVTLERRPGYAKCEIEIKPWHLNVLGVIHGGVLFSLADTVSGTAAAASGEYRVTTVSGNINYLRAGKNTSKITAEAVEVKNGKTFSVCDAKIFDDKGTLLATTTMTFYHLLPRG